MPNEVEIKILFENRVLYNARLEIVSWSTGRFLDGEKMCGGFCISFFKQLSS